MKIASGLPRIVTSFSMLRRALGAVVLVFCLQSDRLLALTNLEMTWDLGEPGEPDAHFDLGSNTTQINQAIPITPDPTSFQADFSADTYGIDIEALAPTGKRYSVTDALRDIAMTIAYWFSCAGTPEYPGTDVPDFDAEFGDQTTGTPYPLTGHMLRTDSAEDIFWGGAGSGQTAFTFTEVSITGTTEGTFGTAGLQTYDAYGGQMVLSITLDGDQPEQDLVTLELIPEPTSALLLLTGLGLLAARRRR